MARTYSATRATRTATAAATNHPTPFTDVHRNESSSEGGAFQVTPPSVSRAGDSAIRRLKREMGESLVGLGLLVRVLALHDGAALAVVGGDDLLGKATHKALAEEFVAAFNKEGGAILKRENTHKQAEANKAFAHFAW